MRHGLPCGVVSMVVVLVRVGAGAVSAPPPVAPPPPPEAATEAILARFEKLAADDEAALGTLAESNDAVVRLAADGAIIRIDAIRSTRRMLTKEPGILKWHGGLEPSLKKWQEGIEY
jgi:hypothetical protein